MIYFRLIKSQDKLHFQARLLALDRLKLAFKDVLLAGGKNRKVAVDKPAEIAALKKSRYNFLKEYRTSAKSISVNVCTA